LTATSEQVLALLARVEYRQLGLAHAAAALQVGGHARLCIGTLCLCLGTLRFALRLPSRRL
jgi:hypothetical protein